MIHTDVNAAAGERVRHGIRPTRWRVFDMQGRQAAIRTAAEAVIERLRAGHRGEDSPLVADA